MIATNALELGVDIGQMGAADGQFIDEMCIYPVSCKRLCCAIMLIERWAMHIE